MILKHVAEDPRLLLRLGMAFLLIALVWPRFLPVTGNLGPDAIDGVRGLLIGLSLSLNLWSVVLSSRQRRA